MDFDVLGIIAPHPPIMVPEVGHEDADVTRASSEALSLARALLERFSPETVIVMSPHSPAFSDAFLVATAPRLRGDLASFGVPQVAFDVPGDPRLAEAILAGADAAGLPAVSRLDTGRFRSDELDHGVIVPMSFLDPAGRWPLVVLSLSFLPLETHRRLGEVVRDAVRAVGRRAAFVASGDCSHRLVRGAPAGYSPRARSFDERLIELLRAGDFAGLSKIDPDLIEAAGECGLRSFITLGGFLEGTRAAPHVLSYEGPWGVGYLTAVFAPPEVLAEAHLPEYDPQGATLTPDSGRKGGSKGSDESPIVSLARAAIDRYVREGVPPISPRLDDPSLPARAGAFVSIHSGGQLRGCIGTIAATRDTLADEVVGNAIEAATRDPRFPPITADELDGLDIKVDVLHEPEHVDAEDELDPRTYGVIVSCDWRRGLLLPDLEGVDTCEDQVSIARRKGGIGETERVRLERFKVDRYA